MNHWLPYFSLPMCFFVTLALAQAVGTVVWAYWNIACFPNEWCVACTFAFDTYTASRTFKCCKNMKIIFLDYKCYRLLTRIQMQLI